MAVSRDKVISVDEGRVFTGPSPDGVYAGPLPGDDQGGVFEPIPGDKPLVEDGELVEDTREVVLGVPKAKAATAAKGPRTYVFTNTRFPSMSIALVDDDGAVRTRTGYYADFHATKLSTTDPEMAQQIRDLNRSYIYEEPAEFSNTDPDSDKFFHHRATGFRTLNKKAFEDWVDNSEWSAKPQ